MNRQTGAPGAFLLDRDGTINVDIGYVGAAEQLKLLHGAAEAIRRMNQAGFRVIVISNQSGVARGYFTIDDVNAVNAQLDHLLAEAGAYVDAYYFCPHLKDGIVREFAVECDCRKPKPGLYQKAVRDYALNPSCCYGCGDRERDIEPLPALGIPKSHLGILDGKNLPGHYPDLLSYTNAMLDGLR